MDTKFFEERNFWEKELRVEVPDVPGAEEAFEEIENLLNGKDGRQAAAKAEKAIEAYGEAEGFLIMLAHAQQLSGSIGKAVKTLEKLNGFFPEKTVYKRELAGAYLERGFGKKALEMFREAYAGGVHDPKFLLLYGACCRERKETEEGRKILREVIAEGKEDLERHFGEVRGAFDELLELEAGNEEVCQELRKELEELEGANTAENAETAEGETQQEPVEETKASGLMMDQRLSNVMKQACLVFSEKNGDAMLQRYLELDLKLQLLECWPQIQGEFAILKADYSGMYDELMEYGEVLENTTQKDKLRDLMLKEYDQMVWQFDRSPYYEVHPERRQKNGIPVWNSSVSGAYRRMEKKIGRNDPCPCGSGKKYKNCYGRK